MAGVTTDAPTRVVVVRRRGPARAGGRVPPGVARVPALVGGGLALAHEAVDLGVVMVRGVRRSASGLAAVVRVLTIRLLQGRWVVVGPTKVRVQAAAVVVVAARGVRIGRVVRV
jgi:hypothetical protein